MLIHILLLHRESNAAVAPVDPRVDVTRRIKGCIAKGGMLGLGLVSEYADALGINPEADVASKLMQIWNKVGVFWLLLAAIPFQQPQWSKSCLVCTIFNVGQFEIRFTVSPLAFLRCVWHRHPCRVHDRLCFVVSILAWFGVCDFVGVTRLCFGICVYMRNGMQYIYHYPA